MGGPTRKALDPGLGETVVGNTGHIRTKTGETVVKRKMPNGGWGGDGVFYIKSCPLKEKGKEFLQFQ